LIFNLYIK